MHQITDFQFMKSKNITSQKQRRKRKKSKTMTMMMDGIFGPWSSFFINGERSYQQGKWAPLKARIHPRAGRGQKQKTKKICNFLSFPKRHSFRSSDHPNKPSHSLFSLLSLSAASSPSSHCNFLPFMRNLSIEILRSLKP